MIDILSIQNKLKSCDVVIYPDSLQKHPNQGWVNDVYTVDSNVGKLVIHIGKYSDDSVQAEKTRRIYGVSKFLSEHPKIPSVDALTYGKDSNGNPFTVQKYMEGKRLEETTDKIAHLKQLAKILAYMHRIDVHRAGHIDFRTNKIQGKHKDWFTFLKRESYNCLDKVYLAKRDEGVFPDRKYDELKSKLRCFFSEYKKYFEGIKGKLLHGDIGLKNIIIHNERIVALLDLEWSCSGDPAWEFAGHEHVDDVFLKEYFRELKRLGASIDEDNFKFRIRLYWVIKSLFIVNTFKKHKEYNQMMQNFESAIGEFV